MGGLVTGAATHAVQAAMLLAKIHNRRAVIHGRDNRALPKFHELRAAGAAST
jgi:hypothetical protein